MDLQGTIKSILSELRSDLFPDIRILVVYVRKKDYYMGVVSLPFKSGILLVDRTCRKIPISGLKAIMAHELFHIKHPKASEREIDQMVVDAGLSGELLSFHDWHNKKYKKYKSSEGLTTRELKRIMKK